MAMRCPFLATPLGGCPLWSCAFSPTAMPATCEPCSHPSQAILQLAPEPGAVEDEAAPGQRDADPPAPRVPCVVEKQASAIVWPARNVWLVSTPVSITATAHPWPVAPAA